MTGKDLLLHAIARLRAAGIENAAGDARVLLAHAIKVPHDRLLLHLDDLTLPSDLESLNFLVDARIRRQPVSQIVGTRLFWGRRFRVTPDVLDPRPETEVLVAAALEEPFRNVLDLGTGSGCILLSLLLDRPGSWGLGVELSDAAVSVAHANRRDYGMEGPMVLRRGSWYEPVEQQFDLIVSNPPYIAEAEMAGLAPEVRDWEPRMALTPGGDGLGAYRAIAAGAPRHLLPGGRILVEIGPTQAAAVSNLLAAAGFRSIRVLPDMDGRDRVISATNPPDREISP
ncbi:MAG: protein-(glutamine-N5) methyltransferase, release factor-specific [Rhodobacterales bacterium 17-64-5]|nr:MAG: protein-(glutamine-N5) methyltransferase, release factor-specific [Rhodobacterales bacterium 17-64-5]